MRQTAFFILLLLLTGCVKESPEAPATGPLLAVPPGFPAPVFPVDNAFSPERWALGKKLFFDPVLSADSTVACASCHRPALAFADDRPFSPGVAGRPGARNAPSLANVAYQPYFTREGGVPTLEMQVLVPIQEHNEFGFNILPIAERLRRDSSYVRMSQAAYQRAPDPFVITRAIACFERSLISGRSRFDAWAYARNTAALSASERRGMQLFFSEKTQCGACHGGFNFTNYAFENNGLYVDYPDPGRYRLTELESDRARFKIPSLRNVALTAPYMHDGSLPSLEAVIEHYDSGGRAHPNKSPLVHPLGLSAREKSDLLAFLHSLTDTEFITNPNFN
ncbi:MAG: cytochrome-c peroxidase [Saprospiraceae bacterium]|nr:cytochrome-c peroxidase [Saprospiraceae bacterium]